MRYGDTRGNPAYRCAHAGYGSEFAARGVFYFAFRTSVACVYWSARAV